MHSAASASRSGPFPADGNRGEFQPIGLGGELESRIGQGIHRDDVAGSSNAMAVVASPCCAPLTSNTVSARAASPRSRQVARRRRPLVLASAVGLVSKQGLEVAGGGELAQRCAQKVGLIRATRDS